MSKVSTQTRTPETGAPPEANSDASLGRALLIVVVALISLIVLVALSPTGEIENQEAAAAAGFDAFAGISLEAKAAVVIDVVSGKTLYEKNAEVQLPLASITKVALALVVAEALPLNSTITIPYFASGAASGAQLLKGERLSVADVIDFTLIESSNNGAAILAEAAEPILRERYGGATEAPHAATIARMNELAQTLGLTQTYFLNVSGLDLSTTQAGAYGSTRDIAKLFAYAASSNPGIFDGTARDGILLTAEDGTHTSASNTNAAQGSIPGLIMGKTGLTDLAGGNLAVVFDLGLSHPVVAVVLGSSEQGRFADMQKLVRAARKSADGGE